MLSCVNKEVLLILLCENAYQCIKIQQNLYLYHQNVQRIEPVWKAVSQRELDHSVTHQRMWVLSCLETGMWTQSLESLRTKSKLNVRLGVRTAYASHELTARFHIFRESVLRVWQYNSLCWSFSTDNTHPEGGHTSYYGLKGQKERRMREQPSHVPISSSSPVSGTPSRLPPAQRKTDMWNKSRYQSSRWNSLMSPTCILWTKLEEHFISQKALLLQFSFNEPVVLLRCDYVQFLLGILKEPILKFCLARKQYIYIYSYFLLKNHFNKMKYIIHN